MRAKQPQKGADDSLKEWRVSTGRKLREAAADLGIALSSYHHLENGRRTPSLELAIRIEKLTDGAVPCRAWEPLLERRSA